MEKEGSLMIPAINVMTQLQNQNLIIYMDVEKAWLTELEEQLML